MMPRYAKSGPTITQVAAAAGVSRATVSRVMNGQVTVAADIAERVRAAAEQLEYRPSTVARSLSLGRTNSVALVVPDLGNPMFQQILRGAVAAAEPFGFRFLVAETVENAAAEAEMALEARLRCDALILAAPRSPEPVLQELLARVEPVVLINREVARPDVPTVRVDYAAGIHSLVDHLVALGHRELAYAAGPRASASHAVRVRALEAARERHPSLRVTTVPCGSTVDDGYGAADAVLASQATAVVAYNDLVAFGLLARLNEIGVDVPADISVAGFDDVELARYANPSLTTVAVPQADLGRRAWGLLHALIASRSAATEPPRHTRPRPESPLVLPGLVVRSSTGPVPPARRLSMVSSDRAGLVKTATPGDPATWSRVGDGWALAAGEQPLARYADGASMPGVHSPRPYLHPVHSLGGIAMTQVTPADHRHHYGVSMAVPDVNGTTYWGGRTFVRGEGPTLLPNHGRQRIVAASVQDQGATLSHEVRWTDERGTDQLLEERRLTGVVLGEVEAWALRWSGRLQAGGTDVVIASPATNGRAGAGYGGLFWRLPFADETTVLTAEGAGEAHGSRSPWLAIARRARRAWTTLLLVQSGEVNPWFVRVADYVGAGPALAWETTRTIPAGSSLPLALTAVVVDRRLGPEDAADLADFALARLRATAPITGE
jgi:LacI family transcriptional regulator